MLIAGPTASGKTNLGVRLALAVNEQGREAAVINADSAQVYRDLHVLSARPTQEEMRGVAHLLFGTWDGAEPCSAADWANTAKLKIAELHANGAVPILVGGTGLYMRTLLEGIAPIPPIDSAIRKTVRALPQADARAALEREDPSAAERIEPADASRTARALEVIRSTGQPLASWQRRKEGGIGDAVSLRPAILLPDRDWIYERCNSRFDHMVDNGAIAEVEALLDRDLSPDLPVMRAIGVREIAALLQGKLSRTQAIEAGQQATRNYAKRQYTWFKRQPPESWPRFESLNNSNMDKIVSLFQF